MSEKDFNGKERRNFAIYSKLASVVFKFWRYRTKDKAKVTWLDKKAMRVYQNLHNKALRSYLWMRKRQRLEFIEFLRESRR